MNYKTWMEHVWMCHAYRNLSPLFCSTFPTSDRMMGIFCLGVFKLRNSAQSYPLECQYHQLTSFSVHEVGNKRCSLLLLYQRHTKLSPVYPQVYWGFTTGFVAMCLSINVSTKDRICIAHEHIKIHREHILINLNRMKTLINNTRATFDLWASMSENGEGSNYRNGYSFLKIKKTVVENVILFDWKQLILERWAKEKK